MCFYLYICMYLMYVNHWEYYMTLVYILFTVLFSFFIVILHIFYSPYYAESIFFSFILFTCCNNKTNFPPARLHKGNFFLFYPVSSYLIPHSMEHDSAHSFLEWIKKKSIVSSRQKASASLIWRWRVHPQGEKPQVGVFVEISPPP